ncbi:MAG: hypothetical protein RLZZ262_1021 [Bacteroidota bacterium]|jgi:hypothetical protein
MKNLFFLVCAALALSSCSHYYYVPAAPTVPLLKEKHEVQANVALERGEEHATKMAQGAFAITNHVAVAGSYMNVQGGAHDTGNYGYGEYADLSLGYFHPIGENLILDVYGGFGRSNQSHHFSKNETADLSFNKIFIRPSIGVKHSLFDLAFTPSLSQVQFHSISSNLIEERAKLFELDKVHKTRTSFLFEPAFTLRSGWNYFKFQAQLVQSINLTSNDLPFKKSQMTVGLSFAFAQRMLKKNWPKRGPSPGVAKVG